MVETKIYNILYNIQHSQYKNNNNRDCQYYLLIVITQQHLQRNTEGRFPLPEFTARVHGPSWRPENSGAFFDIRQLGPWTRVVETDLYRPDDEQLYCLFVNTVIIWTCCLQIRRLRLRCLCTLPPLTCRLLRTASALVASSANSSSSWTAWCIHRQVASHSTLEPSLLLQGLRRTSNL